MCLSAPLSSPPSDTPTHPPTTPLQVGKHLLAYGADVNMANKAGEKPRDVSVRGCA